MSHDFQDEIAFLGIEARRPSCASPRATASPSASSAPSRENLLWVQRFETIGDLRLALLEFAYSYNTHWLVY